MRNLGLGQVIILLLLCFLLFGDFSGMKKKIVSIAKQTSACLSENNRKKGS